MGRDLRLIRIGVTGELRNPAFRLLGVVLAIGAGIYAWQHPGLPGSTAVFLATWGGRVFALACCLWFATGALRDQNHQLGAVLRSKPIDGARWVWVTWATGIALWLALMACPFIGAALAQLPSSGLNSLGAHGLGFLRAALIMVPLGTVAFGLSRLSLSPLGATVVVLAFLCVLAGLQLIPTFLRPDYTQNLALYLAVSLLLLALCGLVVERFRRGELRRPLLPVMAVLGAAALAYGGGSMAYQAAQPPAEGSVQDLMSFQYLEAGKRVPGFWLPDGRGGRVRTAMHHGKILLIYVFAADDLDAARSLTTLDRIQREFKDRGVQVLGICLSTDRGDGPSLALTSGFSFPIGSDMTTTKTAGTPESVLALAYKAQNLPLLVLTDRRRQVRDVRNEYTYDLDTLRAAVQARLTAEPE